MASFCPSLFPAVAAEKHAAGFGGHHIGYWGSLCLIMNNIIGPGLFALPALFQSTGWIPCILCLFLVCILCTQASLYLSRAMASFRANEDFSKRLEYGNTAFYTLPTWAYYLASFTLVCVFFSQNLANILVTSQVMDSTLLEIFDKAYAWAIFKNQILTVSRDTDSIITDSLFGDEYVISLGYVLVLIVCIPLGILNLEDNIWLQIAGCIASVICILVWVVNFCYMGLHWDYVPLWATTSSNYEGWLPTILFNYGFVATIPSWLNEKSPKVPVTSIIMWSQAGATAQFLLVAIFGALALPPSAFAGGADILSVIDSPKAATWGIWHISRIMTYIFPIANILTSIPVFSIIIRYNLLQLKGIKVPVIIANLFAVVLPWVVTLPFYVGDSLDTLINWSSAVFFVALNLLFPVSFWVSMRWRAQKGEPPLVVEQDVNELDSAVDQDQDANEDRDYLLNYSVAATINFSSGSLLEDDDYDVDAQHENVNKNIPVLPSCCAKSDKADLTYAYVLFIFSVVFGVVSLVVEIYTTVTPSSDDDGGDDDGGNTTALTSLGVIGHVFQRLTAQ